MSASHPRRLLISLATAVVVLLVSVAMGVGLGSVISSPDRRAEAGEKPTTAQPTSAPTETSTSLATATPSPTPTPTPTPTEPPVQDATFTIVAAGDVLPHTTVLRRAQEAAAAAGQDGWDFAALWAAMDPWISGADLALCHLEVPITGAETSGYPLFSSPSDLAQDLAASGWDGCSTASNHSVDKGWDGLVSTLAALDDAGLGHVGTARTEQESLAPQTYVLERGGREITVAQIAATFGTNGMPVPADAPWSVQLIDAAQLVAQAEQARADGADLVIASIHWGMEYTDEPVPDQVQLAQTLAESGAIDLVIGNHPHVPQRMEQLPGGPDGAGMWVAYSLGNYISNQDELCCRAQTGTGVLLSATVEAPAEGPVRVSALEWTAIPGDRVGSQRIYPMPDLLSEQIEAPLLTLSRGELEQRQQMVADVIGALPERTQAPTPTGEAAVVIPRS